jgi:hypothetical protein
MTSLGSSFVVSSIVEDSFSVWSIARTVTGFGLLALAVALAMISFVKSLIWFDCGD